MRIHWGHLLSTVRFGVGAGMYSYLYYGIDAYIQNRHEIWAWKLDIAAILVSAPVVINVFRGAYE